MFFGLSTTTKILTSTYGKIVLFNRFDKNKNISLINKEDVLFLKRQSLTDYIPKYNNKCPGHCGIYLGNKKFIHPSKKQKGNY